MPLDNLPRLKRSEEPEQSDDLLEIAERISHEDQTEAMQPLTPTLYYGEH